MSKNTNDIDTDQHARFLEAARALGCDEDEAAFDEKLKEIAGSKNEPLSVAVGADGSSDDNNSETKRRDGTLK